jgi:hypothetical protein
MDKASLTATPHMFMCLCFGYTPPELWINPQCCFAKEKATQINRVVLTLRCIPTNTSIHNPVIVGFVNEMFHHLGRQYHLLWDIHRLIYLNHLVFGQVNYVIAFKEPVVNGSPYDGHLSQSGYEKAARKTLLKKLHKP